MDPDPGCLKHADPADTEPVPDPDPQQLKKSAFFLSLSLKEAGTIQMTITMGTIRDTH
jgi:hypothetical protein